MGARWYRVVVSLVTDIEQLFTYLMAICVSLEKHLFKVTAHFLLFPFFFFFAFCFGVRRILYIFWTPDPYQIYDF